MPSAAQVEVTVLAINGSPLPEAATMSFPCNLITVQAATSSTISAVSSQINFYPTVNNQLQVQEFLIDETVATIAADVADSMFEATIWRIGDYDQIAGLDMLFPSIQPQLSEASGTNINSKILFKGTYYYAEEALADLITAANTGGGGSSYLVEETVVLTHSQILDLASGVEILPAPGQGKLNVFMWAICYMDSVAGQYNFGASDKTMIFYYTPDFNIECSSPLTTSVLTNIAVWQFHPKLLPSSATGYEAYMETNNYHAEASGAQGCANQAISLVLQDTTISGGNAANTLTIKIGYIQMDVVPNL